MVKKVNFLIRVIAFSMILTLLVIETNNVLTPKEYFDSEWPTTTTYKGFYQMEKNSVDVLFFGSSHAASAFNPQEIYNDYGIRSYNLACEQQNILVSYYWLKEALRYQTPKAVVLDVYLLFEYNHAEPNNIAEPYARKAMDPMKMSKVKLEAINAICENDSRQSVKSYIFKNIRFHTRWTNLSEQDFTFRSMEKHYELKGYAPLGNRGMNVQMDYQPYSDFDTTGCATPVPLMQEYLDKIEELCAENNIELVLVKTPSAEWSVGEHNYVAQYANEHNIGFVDYNVKENYDASGFSFAEDMNDNGHGNIWGAKKVSLYIADKLCNQYGVGGKTDRQWSETNEYYQNVVADYELKYISNLDAYIDAINQSRYTILLSTRYDMTFCMNDDVKESFAKLGLNMESEPLGSYCAAITDSDKVELSGNEILKYSGSTRDRLQNFTIVSGGDSAGSQSSIRIGNEEYSKDQIGINIVVYSEETRKVIDSSVFDGNLRR